MDGAGNTGPNQLYALNTDGSLTIVSVTEKGSSSTTVEPLALFNTASYLLVDYMGVSHDGVACNFVAARKTDGALFCVTAPGVATPDMAQRSIAYGQLVQSDATGNLVWINEDEIVTLLNLGSPAAPTQQTVAGVATNPNTPPQDGPFNMAVNAAGDALLSDYHQGGRYTRVFFPGGGFFGVSDQLVNCVVAGPSSNPNGFYFWDSMGVEDLTPDAGNTFSMTTLAIAGDAGGASFDCAAGVVTAGTDIFMTTDTEPAILDISGSSANVLSVAPLAKIDQVGTCDASVFLLGVDASGNGGIVRYDLAGKTFSTLVTPGAYALTTMSVSPGCDVTFYGQRAVDGAYILGTIAAGTDQVSVNATGFPQVVQIERIN